MPALPTNGPTEWFHEVGPESTAYPAPSVEWVGAPARIDFTLHNRSRERLPGNPYDWTLYEPDDGERFRVEGEDPLRE